MKSEIFTNVLTDNYRRAWVALKAVIVNVLGKHRVEETEVKQLVENMLNYYHQINASMTLKLHFLRNHLDKFLKQLPSESDEQGERFHQITMPMEKRYKGKKLDALVAEVGWWSHKISQYEDEDTEDTGDGGHTERDMPLNLLSTLDDGDSDNEHVPLKKRSRATSKASTSMDIDKN